ncbi:DUF6241 domain-containing protein [Rossellomorea vietnamensis]|uniref:DUF6241 domain-containing protein n=1 Tax=Rossellomorea vietnamensis TaxID=218284 RepID=UPI001E2F9D82|nr:DUF6241 domain-containing protein [Rossellomorea vietnamensis]MCC5803198.1 hypothetical protein [Rossellomorea vietnamensis]
MSKKTVGIIIGSVLLLTALGVYIAVGSLDMSLLGGKGTEQGSNDGGVEQTATTEVQNDGEDQEEVKDGNPFGEKVKTPLSEVLMQQYIHAMSHQKVQAKEKWSYFKITDERIDFLLNQLEINKYEHENTYKEILTSWKDGDFSDAVSDHNKIWRIQEGTIGKATGLLSPKAEEAYISEQKKEKR